MWEIRCLESILNHKMDVQEAKAHKLACMFIAATRKMFPNIRDFAKGYEKGDPRKKFLFKVCHKLLRETAYKIDEKDYHLYIKSQLDIISVNTKRSGKDPYISPSCLVGPKAWNRWSIWKKLYDRKIAQRAESAEEAKVDPHEFDRIKSILEDDYKFLNSKKVMESDDAIQIYVNNRSMIRWVATKQLSPYYALLSTKLNDWLEDHKLTLDSMIYIDFDFYRPSLSDQVKDYYYAKFPYERRTVN